MSQIIKDPTLIRRRLSATGTSEAALSRATGMTKKKLNDALHGKRALSLHELIKIAEALGVSWPSLLPVYGISDPTAHTETSAWPQHMSATEFRKMQKDVRAIEQWISTIRQAFDGFRP